ncbi:MAG: GGDEF domain-containing protein [Rubrobacteraceae bacterium]
MESASRIPAEIQNKIPEILTLWRRSRLYDAEDEAAARLTTCMERLISVFVDFLRSPDSVETFSQGGRIRSLVREISGCQHELDRDAVGVIEDFAVLRRSVWRSAESNIDLSKLDGAEVAHFFTKLLAASDWVTEAGLEAFEATVREDMQEALGKAAATDLLTGLPDRERFNRALLPQAMESYEQFSLAVFGIADFSDTVAEGEIEQARNALKKLAEAVAASVPEAAICARFGDDEVCALLPGLASESAYRVSEGVLERLAAEDLGFEVDVGVAEYPAHGSDADSLVQQTLRAMSMAKRVGGSGIVVAR